MLLIAFSVVMPLWPFHVVMPLIAFSCEMPLWSFIVGDAAVIVQSCDVA